MDKNEIRSTVEGWLTWELVSAAGEVVQAGEQHNLVLNSGLDWLGSNGLFTVAQYIAVGTGSTAPAVTQTGLTAEVARTASADGNSDTQTRVSNGVYRLGFTREFTEAQANGNLTEWGTSPSAVGNLFARELFRDAGGNPVVVTKDNTQKLRLIYTFEVRITPVVPTAAAVNIAGLGNRTGRYSWLTLDDSNADLNILNMLMRGAAPSRPYRSAGGMYLCESASLTGYSSFNLGNRLAEQNDATIPGYVAGSYQRGGYSYTFDTSVGNGTLNGVFIAWGTNYGSSGAGWGWVFDAGQEIVKSNLDRLMLTGPSVSWGRA